MIAAIRKKNLFFENVMMVANQDRCSLKRTKFHLICENVVN